MKLLGGQAADKRECQANGGILAGGACRVGEQHSHTAGKHGLSLLVSSEGDQLVARVIL